jgi:hypothetical protein
LKLARATGAAGQGLDPLTEEEVRFEMAAAMNAQDERTMRLAIREVVRKHGVQEWQLDTTVNFKVSRWLRAGPTIHSD